MYCSVLSEICRLSIYKCHLNLHSGSQEVIVLITSSRNISVIHLKRKPLISHSSNRLWKGVILPTAVTAWCDENIASL